MVTNHSLKAYVGRGC